MKNIMYYNVCSQSLLCDLNDLLDDFHRYDKALYCSLNIRDNWEFLCSASECSVAFVQIPQNKEIK